MLEARAERSSRASLLYTLNDYLTLTKPRIMALLLLTTFGAMALAYRGIPPAPLLAAVMIGGALASGGASALNHCLERDTDPLMGRTRNRPVASGRVSPRAAFAYGVGLNVLAFIVLGLWANILTAGLAMAGTLFYVIVYTLWLKRTTPQNIVIGGAAGAIPPLVGWASITGTVDLPAWYLFAIVFFWTPPHFWALAIMLKDQYRAAGIPMLPVVMGLSATRVQILLYTFTVVALSVLLWITSEALGAVYLAGALTFGSVLIYLAARLVAFESKGAALDLYLYSLLYLALLFVVVAVDASIS
ncbi:MAG: protoheme IX farnesyltransferase [Chloroflexi bacterium]|nr:protoheme IX farnesyltransferase [Chloroflexota bacterium]